MRNLLGVFVYLGPSSIFRVDKVEPPFRAKVLRREENKVRKDVCAACGLAQGMTECAVVRDSEGSLHVVGVDCLERFAVNFVLDEPGRTGTPSTGSELKPASPDNLNRVTQRERDEYRKVLVTAINETRIRPLHRDTFTVSLVERGRALQVALPPLPKLARAAASAKKQISAGYGWPKKLSEQDTKAVHQWLETKRARDRARSELFTLRTDLAESMLEALAQEERVHLG
jgi:hypothetical protein